MSIQNKRIGYLTEKILKENLQKGFLPDSQEFIWQLNQALYYLNNDKASFSFSPYQNTQILKSKKLNEDNTKIYEDLHILYDNNKHINSVLNREYQYFLIKKKKLEKELDIEENRLKEYVENNARGGYLPYAYDTLDNTDKIDLEKTSRVFIDTNYNKAELVQEKNQSKRIFPESELSFSVLPRNLDAETEEIEPNIQNILDNKEDNIWQKRISVKENIEMTGQLEINFKHPQLINNINLSIISVKSVDLDVYFSKDKETWYTLPYHDDPIEVEKEISLDFPEMEIKHLRFVVRKSEYDESHSNTKGYHYQYLFGFESISFYNKAYPSEGVLHTKELELQNRPDNYLVDTVQLHTDEVVPTGSELRYEVALPGEQLDWQPIDPVNKKHPEFPQTVRFHQLRRNSEHELFFPDDLSVRQSEAEDLLKNGIPLYKLTYQFGDNNQFYLPKTDILEGSLRLYVGKNTAEVISYPADDKKMTIEDFLKVADDKKHYYESLSNISSGDIFSGKRDDQPRRYLARIGLYLEESQDIVASPTSTEEVIIYLNGNELYQGRTSAGDTIHYNFRAGWNELVVLIDGQNANTVNGMTTSLGFNFYDITDNIYSSSKPLKEVSVFDLQNNIKLHDRTVFAKRETTDGIEVLTNFAQEGLKFDLFFDYKESFKEEKGILMRVFFSREVGDNTPSPLLRKYRLLFS